MRHPSTSMAMLVPRSSFLGKGMYPEARELFRDDALSCHLRFFVSFSGCVFGGFRAVWLRWLGGMREKKKQKKHSCARRVRHKRTHARAQALDEAKEGGGGGGKEEGNRRTLYAAHCARIRYQ